MSGNRDWIQVVYWIAVIVVSAATTVGIIYKASATLLKAIAFVKGVMSKTVKKIKKLAVVIPWIIILMVAMTVTYVVVTKATARLIAVVYCEHWKAPHDMETQLPDMGVQDLCSMYTVKIRNESGRVTKNSVMSIPTANYIAVAKGKDRVEYKDAETISLPPLQDGRGIDLRAWATCKANRPNAERVLITHDRGPAARLDVRIPVRTSARWVNRHIRIVWVCLLTFVGAASVYIGKRLISQK